MKRLISLVLALFLLGGGLLFAQNKGALTVQCNVVGAQVSINGKLAGYTTPNFSQLLAAGVYKIKVSKAGYPDFNTTVTMAGQAVTITAVLGAPAVAPPPVVVPPPQILQYSISVNANVQGADVIINGNPAGKTPFSAQVPQGSYTVTVRAPGYLDFSQNVVVNGPVQVNANLQPLQATLSVTANVQGAEVVINGNPAGRTPFSAQLPQGSYTVTVRAPGYRDYSQNVLVSGPVQVNAILQTNVAAVTITSNVQGADVVINEGLPLAQRGKTPLTVNLPLGNPPYTIKVSAPGYQDFFQTLAVTGPVSVNATLQPLAASFQVAVPEAYVNKDLKGGHWSQIMIYVDGVLQRGATGGQLLPGRHVIRVTSGGMAVETVVEAQAGRTYVLEPFMGLSVK